MPSKPTDPDTIIHALEHCETQQHGAYLGICNHTDCQRNLEHGEPVTIHAYYSECNNNWHITALRCRDHNPDTTFTTNHSHTTAIATAIFNFPTDIPPRPHPHLSDFTLVETSSELPQLEAPDRTPTESEHAALDAMLDIDDLLKPDDEFAYITENELEDPDDRTE